jgi:hypothetical protein
MSFKVQGLLSEQGAELDSAKQPLEGLQLSAVHGLPSLHTVAVPGRQTLPPQVSPNVQASSSSQGSELATNWQPALGSQLLVVQGL